jgi:hypothetical protein
VTFFSFKSLSIQRSISAKACVSGSAVPSGGICTRGSRERMRSGSTLASDWPGTTSRVGESAPPCGRKRLAMSISERRTDSALPAEPATDCASTMPTGTDAPDSVGDEWQ